MNLDELIAWLLVGAASLFIVSAAILIYTCGLLLAVRARIRSFNRRPQVARDGDGRPIRERV